MAIQPVIMQSIFPDLPRETPAVDKNGDFNTLWELGFSSLFQALQTNFKNEGIVFPSLSATNMTNIQNLYAPYVGGTYEILTSNLPDISGQTVFDMDTYISNQFVIVKDNSGAVTLAEWVPLAVMLTNAGNPNGTTAGVLNWLCYDIVNKILYICTISGTTTSTVWTPV